MKKQILLFLNFIVILSIANAQAPNAIPYQGVARNVTGNILVSQPISLRISIRDISAAGTIIFRETHSTTTNTLGLFNINIGLGTPVTSTLAAVNWGGATKFLQVELDPAGGTSYINMGTTQLNSVPYALFAAKSANLPTGTVSGNTMHWNGSAWVADNGIFNNGTNVGIGTTIPTAKLHTTGTTRFEGLTGAGTRPVFADGSGNLTIAKDSTYSGTNSTAGAIPDGSCTGVTRIITLAGLPVSINTSTISVTVNITHPLDGDLRIYLTEPNGATLNLAFANGGAGANFTSTVFNDNAANFLSSGTAPFTGSFKPTGNNTTVCSTTPTATTFTAIGGGSINPNGNWTLKVFDQGSNAVTGTFISWTISLVGADLGNIGTNNFLPKWSNFNLTSTSNIFDNGTSVGIGTASPAASALLHVNSTSKGVLFPQVSIDSLKDVTSIASPANGLVVYNTTQPGVRNDMQRGYYYYSTNALTWVRLADNFNDNSWQDGGLLGIQLRDKTDGVEIMDDFTGSSLNWTPKVKILKQLDSALLNSKNNMNTLVLTAVNRKINAGWESRQKNSIIFENGYYSTGSSSGTIEQVAAISGYSENPGTTNAADRRYNGLAFYTFSVPTNTASADTPSVSMLRHNVGIGAYASDINNVTEGRLQITGFSNGDQLSLRHPSSTNLKWGFYVSSIDSSLNFYSNGSLRANIDRVTGVYAALSDRNLKKNIVPLSPVLSSIMQLSPYSYNYLDSKDSDHRTIGFMAQDILPYFPELVYKRHNRETGKPFYMMSYEGFGVIAIKAIQEQQKIIETQNSKIVLLEDEIKKIKEALQIK